MNFNNNRHSFQSIGKIEIVVIVTLLLLVFAMRIISSFELNELQAFDQYNLFFDADSNQYLSAAADGWGSNRPIHPGYALLINIPIRAIDHVTSATGILDPGVARNIIPIVLPALFGFIGGIFWWLSCVESGFRCLIRVGGLILLQGSFSQTIFAVIPESYGLSSMLLCILLWAAIRGANNEEMLSRWHVRIGWLMLAITLSAVTVTNGVLCIAVWMALRFNETIRWQHLIREGLVAMLILLAGIAITTALDDFIYDPTSNLDSGPNSISKNITDLESFSKRTFTKSSAERLIEMPAHALASIVAPVPEKARNESAERDESRYQFGFSIIDGTITWQRIIIGWLLVVGGIFIGRPKLRTSAIARICTVVLLFNVLLLGFWGSNEMFLYSQHWLAFFVFVIVTGLSTKHRITGPILIVSSSLLTFHNILILSGLIEILRMTI